MKLKKITVMLSFIMMFFVGIVGVKAAETPVSNGTIYGNITMSSQPFTSSNPITLETYYITKTTNGYVYMTVKPTLNISSITIDSSSAFSIVNQTKNSDGSITVLFKTKSGSAINNTKTELMVVTARIADVTKDECQITVSPLGMNCLKVNNTYFDNSGKVVTEAQWKAACESSSTTPSDPSDPDVPNNTTDPSNPSNTNNPQTGNYIPYMAVAAGLIAIAGVYFYSKKSNKMYKL